MRDKDKIICHCQEVTYETILEAISNGAKTVEVIGDITEAGITCGTCIEEIEDILEEELE
ncbi:MAG: (2Fe-2S)-binding protein [Candidatus Izimaplasma sp.]|nr:(2Fe-2S)-binding protein [Candidatus Izimaplasma bacterium]